MAIHTEETVRMSGGFSKEIDKGALPLIFDNLQRFQYQYPVKSTIREVVSNGLDSVREKNVARSILLGASKVEDHYENREGDVYKDSHFNPEYYDLSYFSSDDNVLIEYISGNNASKDFVRITDNGVGLGGQRLAGYFNLGFSTKRLSRFPLGKFGLGAKSPLSTGAPFYTLTSWHNGWEYMFNIYNQNIESVIPKWDMQTQLENDLYYLPGVFDKDGNKFPVYRRKTTHKNGSCIELQVKKHHKQQYIDAVTGQLLYFSNVQLIIYDENQVAQTVPVKANIMYEDEYIVLASNSPYTKPHILLNNVNYGTIDFRELELEDRMGNVGIKVIPDEVSVNPSRESLIWDDVTREAVTKRFNQVLDIAEQTVSKELNEEDFFLWVRACSLANSSSTMWYKGKSDSTVLGRLASIIDMSKVEMRYVLNKNVKYSYRLFAGINNRVVSMSFRKEGSKTIRKVCYEPGIREALSNDLPVVLQFKATSNRKNKYMTEVLYPKGFINLIVPDYIPVDRKPVAEDVPGNSDEVEEWIKVSKASNTQLTIEQKEERRKKAREYIADVFGYILESKSTINYEDVVVPDDYKGTDEAEEEIQEEEVVEETQEILLSASERRALNGNTLIHALRLIPDEYQQGQKHKAFEFCAIDVHVSRIDQWKNEETFWGNQNDEPLLQMAGLIMRPYEQRAESFGVNMTKYNNWIVLSYSGATAYDYARLVCFRENSPVRLFKVSQQNSKLYRDFPHVTRFFKIIKNKTLTMSNALIRWNTGRLIHKGLTKLRFLSNFHEISPRLEVAYKELLDYSKKYYRDIQSFEGIQGSGTMANPLVEHLDKVKELQLFVRDNPEDKEGITAMVTDLFNPDPGIEITNGCAIDTEMYDKLVELLDWAEPVYKLMNMVDHFCKPESKHIIDPLEIEAVEQYFRYRNCPLSF